MTTVGNLVGKRIGMFGKGGAGKSTVVALLAKQLQKAGYPVCVLDADSTNIGLPQALGFDHAPTPLIDYFGGMIFSGGLVTCPVDDPTPLNNADLALNQIPSDYQVTNRTGLTLLTAGKIGGQGPGAGCDGPVAKIARDVRVVKDGQDCVTLIDFKAGFEDSARGAITSLDWAVVVVDPTTASVEMAASMDHMVKQIKAGVLPATKHLEDPDLVIIANNLFTHAAIRGVVCVMNKISNTEVNEYLRAKLADKGLTPAASIPEDTDIAMAWLKGLPVSTERTERAVTDIIAHLETLEAEEAAHPA